MQIEEIKSIIKEDEKDADALNIIRFGNIDELKKKDEMKQILAHATIYKTKQGIVLYVFNNNNTMRLFGLMQRLNIMCTLNILRLNFEYEEVTYYTKNVPVRLSGIAFKILENILCTEDLYVRLNFGPLQSLAYDKTDIDELTVIHRCLRKIIKKPRPVSLHSITEEYLARVTVLYGFEPENVMEILSDWNDYNLTRESVPIVPYLDVKEYEGQFYDHIDDDAIEIDYRIENFEFMYPILKVYKNLLCNTINGVKAHVLLANMTQDEFVQKQRKYYNIRNKLTFVCNLIMNPDDNTLIFEWTSRGKEYDKARLDEIRCMLPEAKFN